MTHGFQVFLPCIFAEGGAETRNKPHSFGTFAGTEEFRKFQVSGPRCRDPFSWL